MGGVNARWRLIVCHIKSAVIRERILQIQILDILYPLLMANINWSSSTGWHSISLSWDTTNWNKTLSATLKEMENDSLIIRTEYPQIPAKVEYSLSERGRSLIPILISMCQWGSQHKSDYVQGKAKEYDNDNQTC